MGEGWDGGILTAGKTPSPLGARPGWLQPNNKNLTQKQKINKTSILKTTAHKIVILSFKF